ncbi:phosphotransferase family protein [Luteipulveratus mongoliensis]|uniref:Aminoglycoside phosphotransferase n=1 Tax=Luteipulveratus mongoliensis TaxID=571913 RepID=A0A0K1JKZ3_9MICO|nr:phosphotransferase family protein [Luteipulveratus mongoliensis]AKU17243.1 aminoglycoside phosphotransferase [Luteipulveratus mongoliensis]
MPAADEAREVRQEDAFDVATMATWLREHATDATGLAGTPEVRQFSGGASNLTYLLSYADRDLVLRRPPGGHKAKSAHDMRREFTIQQRLGGSFPYVPQMLAFCDDEAVIGSDFYVMQRLEGVIPHKEMPAGVDLSPGQARTLCRNVLDVLVELHQVDAEAAGLTELARGSGYVARQVKGWSDRYGKARTRNVASFGKVMTWLDANQPQDIRNCLIHNDFRLDNVVLDTADPTKVRGVLDWEMATVGDPLMDLGGSMAYWVQADDNLLFRMFRRQPSHLPGMLSRREIVHHYCERSGLSLSDEEWAFYEVFGLFRLAAIAQQIYYRYYNKQTTNPRFKNLYLAVNALEWRCRTLIRKAGR